MTTLSTPVENEDDTAKAQAGEEQSPTSLLLPAQRSDESNVPEPQAATERESDWSVLGRYLGYVAYFVGAGLISGAVVHHPMDPSRYTKIAAAGVVVFLFVTIFNEFVLTRTRPGVGSLARALGLSLLLSFGLGMLSGGLQHFEDFPDRAAMLIPSGIVLSFAAYVVHSAPARWEDVIGGRTGLVIAVVVLLAGFGLRHVAATIEPGAGGHGHGSGGTVAEMDGSSTGGHNHADH